MKINKNNIIDNIKTLFWALLIAVVIRSLFIQPFYIPSSSMEPTLLIGDRLFVTKYSYGYSRHSFPFSPPILKSRIFFSEPKRGDVVVFRHPRSGKDYIKRVIGLPGDKIKIENGVVFINDRHPKATNKNGELASENDWKLEETVLGNNVSIGSSATIMCGIKIGDNSIIGAGSLVLKDVKEGDVFYKKL